MQTLPACRVHTLQVDEGYTAAHALIETMLNLTAHCAVENGQEIEALGSGWDTRPGLDGFI